MGATYYLEIPTPGEVPPIARIREGIVANVEALLALVPSLAGSSAPALLEAVPDGSMKIDLVPPILESIDGSFEYRYLEDGTIKWTCYGAGSVTIRFYQVKRYDEVNPTAIPTPTPPATGQGS